MVGDVRVNDPKRRDIINLDTSRRTAVVSDIYHEYQHADVVTELAKSFGKAGIEIHGSIKDYGDQITVSVFFDNIQAIKDPTSDKGIVLGARFRNSYNKQNSVTGTGYFMRMFCENQMHFGNLIHELRFSERHTGSIVLALPEAISDFTTGLLMRSRLVETQVKIASETPVRFETAEQRRATMVAMVGHEKVGGMVDDKLMTIDLTKYDIYNAITATTTHDAISDGVRDRIEKVSERILSPEYHVIPEAVV